MTLLPAQMHIVGWPLVVASLLEATGLRARLTQNPHVRRACGGVAHRYPAAGARQNWLHWIMHANLLAMHVSMCAILAYAVSAFLRPGYTEWVERGVVAVATYWAQGGNIYPSPAILKILGIFPYGPLLFQTVGVGLAASGDSEAAVKMLPAALLTLSYAGLFWMIRKRGAGFTQSAVAIEILAVVVGIMGFMMKGDVMLIFLVVLGCGLASWRKHAVASGILLAACAGAASAIKIHGAFYLLPAVIEWLAVYPDGKRRKLATGVMIAAAIAMAPFLIPRTSLENYLYVLFIASNDGWRLGIFISNLIFICTACLCVHLVTAPALRDRRYHRLMVSVLAAGLFISIFAAKTEAGPHHLIPLLPYLCIALGTALVPNACRSGDAERTYASRLVLLTMFVVAFQPITGIWHDIVLMLGQWSSQAALI